MSLDVTLLVTQPTAVYDNNITHNLVPMAKEVKVSPAGLTLYDVMWYPSYHGIAYAHELIVYLDKGYQEMLSQPDKYKQFNPENGWGNYYGLLHFVESYRTACIKNPNAEIEVSV